MTFQWVSSETQLFFLYRKACLFKAGQWRRQKGNFSGSLQKYSLFLRPIQKKIGLFKLAQPVHYAYILYWIHYVIICSSVRALQCFIQPYN